MKRRDETNSLALSANPRIFAAAAITFALLVTPVLSHAATLQNGRTITVSSSTPDNAYYVGGTVTVAAPLPADLSAVGGTITVSQPVAGEALLAGGTIDVQKTIAGSLRVAGGRITVENNVLGDLMAAGGFINVSGRPKDAYIAGGTVQLTGGAGGPVTIYGADVYLSGEFDGDVDVVAADHISVAPNTVIHGSFKYNAPQQADIPDPSLITGGVNYVGAAHYLPTVQQAQQYAVAGLWVFILVRITAILVVTGLVTGLFSVLTGRIVESTMTRSAERFILLALLGLAGFVGIPVLLILLLVSFVGIGIAFVVGAAYLLYFLLAYIYAAAIAGSAIMWVVKRQTAITWRAALLGALVLYLIDLIPVLGFLVHAVLCSAAGGAILLIFYRFAFPRHAIDMSDV
ncbi:MAG: hypothetical protein P4M11_05200 [Candidatus Pacebacteria bacterium]|nr:hypothetical protein [Candidatus Paceibacterota bacterium]